MFTLTRSGRGAHAGGSAISWGQWWFGARGFEADAANWVLDPFLAERILLPLRLRSATAHVWTHVMICVEANLPPASARVRPRMCERTFTSKNCIGVIGRIPVWYNYIPNPSTYCRCRGLKSETCVILYTRSSTTKYAGISLYHMTWSLMLLNSVISVHYTYAVLIMRYQSSVLTSVVLPRINYQ